MTTYAIIAAVVSGAVSLIIFAIKYANARAEKIGRAEAINEMQKADTDAVQKFDKVMGEHRTSDDAARSLRDGNF